MNRRLRAVIVTAVSMSVLAAFASSASATLPGTNGQIAYSAVRARASGLSGVSLRTIHADGSPGTVLWRAGDPIGTGAGRAYPVDAEWSPDGSLVAMVARGDRLRDARLLIGDPTTRDRSVIFRVSRLDDHTFIASIAFAPTGGELLFCGVTLHDTATPRLYTIGIDGSHLTMVSDHPDCYADWSSTNRIVAASGVGDIKRMVTMDPDGSHRQLVTSVAGYDATWAPDGIGFAYSRPVEGTQRLDLFWIGSPDGRVRKRLTRTPRRDDVYPLFSPDGARIAFTRTKGPNDAAADLFTMTANGTNVRRLTDTPNRIEFTRSWQPLTS